MSFDILIVDDEADIRKLIRGILEDDGYRVSEAASSAEAYKAVNARTPDLIILDIWLQGSEQDGLGILAGVKATHPGIPVIMISGHGTIETAVFAIKEGAYDFIEKPFKADRLLVMINRALETAALRRENEALRGQARTSFELVGKSAAMESVRQVIKRVAPTNSRVLITGEPGTGKNLAAQMVYMGSERASRPYVVLNCATLRPDQFETELFGQNTPTLSQGVLEKAHGGTLLLDEVADLPLETQGKIVRVLQEQSFRRVGGEETVNVDVRIIAASNRNLEEEIAKGSFRQDLYYRLNVVPVAMPALREYAQDIPALCAYFLEDVGKQLGFSGYHFTPEALKILKSYNWPGNVRQLRNVIEWVFIMHGHTCAGQIGAEHLPTDMQLGGQGAPAVIAVNSGGTGGDILELPLREAREEFEREYLRAQMDRFEGHISKMAEFVGMERSALHRKLKSLNIGEGDADNKRKSA